jgi:hypothetical protein
LKELDIYNMRLSACMGLLANCNLLGLLVSFVILITRAIN